MSTGTEQIIEMYTTPQICKLLGITRDSLYKSFKGKFTVKKAFNGRDNLYYKNEVDAYVEERKKKHPNIVTNYKIAD